VSYLLGTYNSKLIPIAAATILLWALADSSLTNQLLYNKSQNLAEIKKYGTLKRLLLVKNLSIVVISIPLTIVFGLILVIVTGSWNEIIYGVVMALVLIWGWLGISNALSVYLPFELMSLKQYLKNKNNWLRYGILYCMPWVILPIYALIMLTPFYLLGWTKADAARDHRIIAMSILIILSILIWLAGLNLAQKYSNKPNNRLKKLIRI
jgi:hypothetical protein